MNTRMPTSVLFLLFPAPVLAATLSVDPSGAGDSTTIQGAIDLAADGDTIEVMPGTYAESIMYDGKDIAIVSTGGSAVTTITTSSSTLPTVGMWENEGVGVVLEGFTLHNDAGGALVIEAASPTITDIRVVGGGSASTDGAGIWFDNGDPVFTDIEISGVTALNAAFYINDGNVTINDLAISDSTATYGGAMFVGLATVEIDGATISRNKASDRAGALYVDRAALTIRDFLFDANTTDGLGPMADVSDGSDLVLDSGFVSGHSTTGSTGVPGGAVWLDPGANLTATNVSFSTNTGIVAGAITAFGANTVTLEGCEFSGNSAIAGGAIVGYGTTLTITGSGFADNTAVGLGGALLCQAGCAVVIDTSNFSRNTSTDEQGGAVALQQPVSVSMDGTWFVENTSALEGGGLYLYDAPGTVQISSGVFDGNVAGGRGGGLYGDFVDQLVLDGVNVVHNDSVGGGGGIFLNYDSSAHLSQVLAQLNTTSGSGGALALAQSPGGSFVAKESTFQSNTATEGGGGISVADLDQLTVSGSVFGDNIAGGSGGAIRSSDLASGRLVSNTIFYGNSAASGGAIDSTGTLTADSIANTVFVSNVATVSGGALRSTGDTDVRVTNVAFLANDAPLGAAMATEEGAAAIGNAVFAWQTGGAAISASSAVTATYSDFWDNTGNAIGTLTDGDVAASTGNLAVEPLFLAWSDDGDSSNDDFVPASGSPLIDAGDPALTDVDGTRSDIGPWAGPGSAIYDGDGDGVWNNSDCDDADEDVFPGALDVPYDGVDQDCLGGDLVDVDGDGWDAIEAGGTDCDDEDQSVYPGAADAWYDGVDSDCAGNDDDDQDGDGFAAEAQGGDDCDDLAAGINTSASEVWYDGTDQDCDGRDDDQDADGHDLADDCDDTDPTVFGLDGCDPVDTDEPGDTDDTDRDTNEPDDTDEESGGGCKCATPGLAFGGVWPLLAAVLLVRRRR